MLHGMADKLWGIHNDEYSIDFVRDRFVSVGWDAIGDLRTFREDKDALKRRKPKNSIVKSNSSFISTVIIHESLAKRLADHPADGMFAFVNINRALQWLDLFSPNKVIPVLLLIFWL